MGFSSLWHMHRSRSGSRGLCLPATFRPQGLITLSTVCALARLAGHISCRQRLWDSPFGAFSSSKVAPALRPPPTRLPLPARLRQRGPKSTQAASPASSATGCFLWRVPRGTVGCLARPTAGGSLGFRPLQGLHPLVLAGISARLLSHVWPSPQLPLATALTPQSVDRQTASPPIAGRTPLLGFLRLNVPGTRPCREPGLCVHLVSRRTLPCDHPHSWGPP